LLAATFNTSQSMKIISTFYVVISILFGLLKTGIVYSQDIDVKLGFADSIQSPTLKENRKIIIRLPEGYDTSKKTYPVLYLLDGNNSSLLETVSAINKLGSDENIPQMIVVAIGNTDRDRDMMPLSTNEYSVPVAGAEQFLSFIGDELIPQVDKKYRTNQQRILCGKSLSGLFTLYALLTRPQLFEGYIGRSAGWLRDMNDYFTRLTDNAFQQPNLYKGKKIFMSNSLIDTYDKDHVIHKQMLEFSEKIKAKLGNSVQYKYVTYSNYPHVPFPSLYDGLKYIFEGGVKK
jgi:predicted alpha/beta superfamily hydrolase